MRYQVRYDSEHAEKPRGALFDTYTNPEQATRAAKVLTRTFRTHGLRHEARSVRVITLNR